MVARPTYLSKNFAYNTIDKNVIPESPNPLLPGNASLELGFPPLTKVPLVSGGLPPLQEDFNGALFHVYQFLSWAQAGGQALWNVLVDEYQVNNLVFGSDGLIYKCVQVNGSSTTPVDPTTDVPDDYWEILTVEGLTASRALVSDPTGKLVVSTTTAAEIDILQGATVGLDKVATFDAAGQFTPSAITTDELDFLAGVTDNLRQTTVHTYVTFVGSTGVISESKNVSSVVRNSTGNYTINFINSLDTATYSVAGSGTIVVGVVVLSPATRSLSNLTCETEQPGTGNIDAALVSVIITGGIS